MRHLELAPDGADGSWSGTLLARLRDDLMAAVRGHHWLLLLNAHVAPGLVRGRECGYVVPPTMVVQGLTKVGLINEDRTRSMIRFNRGRWDYVLQVVIHKYGAPTPEV